MIKANHFEGYVRVVASNQDIGHRSDGLFRQFCDVYKRGDVTAKLLAVCAISVHLPIEAEK